MAYNQKSNKGSDLKKIIARRKQVKKKISKRAMSSTKFKWLHGTLCCSAYCTDGWEKVPNAPEIGKPQKTFSQRDRFSYR